MSKILMSSNEQGVFKMEFVEEIPEEAKYDNWAEVDGVSFKVYAMPHTRVVGRTIALQMWLEDQFKDEEEDRMASEAFDDEDYEDYEDWEYDMADTDD